MEFKGTKEKWYSSYQNGSWLIQNEDDFNNDSTKLYSRILLFYDGRDTAEANVKLITKAPEMLDMLNKCKDYFKNKDNNYYKVIEQLIKEATEL
jgi:hypothetical protein